MTDQQRDDDPIEPDPQPGGASERDFGKTDRYATRDEPFNVRSTGDGTSWDSGREASIGRGTPNDNDLREADVETPGAQTRDSEEE